MMLDDPVLPSLEDAYRIAMDAKTKGQRDFTLTCCAWGRPYRPFIYVHGCLARVLRRFRQDDVDCILVRLNVIDMSERYRREVARRLAGELPIAANAPKRVPRAVMAR